LASALLTVVFAAAMFVVGQMYIEKRSTRIPTINHSAHMIGVFTELLGGDASLPTRQIYRSIISPQIKVMRSLLQRTELTSTGTTCGKRLLGRISLAVFAILSKFPSTGSQLRSSVIHCRISIILQQRHPSGNIVGGAGQ
jgi:hypothetical protein